MSATALMRLREVTFWYLDRLKGGMVKKAYEELKKYDRMDSRSTELIHHQLEALEQLLVHATLNTQYYKKHVVETLNLNDFPIIDKNIIRGDQDSFISNIYEKDRLLTISTSGSTGTPFVCYQNIEKKRRVNAEIIYYGEKIGYTVGKSLIFLRSLTKATQKPKLKQFLQNQPLIDIRKLDDDEIKKILFKIEQSSQNGSILMSYASTYDILRDYFLKNGMDNNCNIDGIISGAEMLFDETRDVMEKAFDCKCISRYSNQENGVLGQDDIENNTFILNEAHYYIEILNIDNDKPAKEGQVGRIVITDLYNYAMPMIRYDTGDVGTITYIERDGVRKKAITNFGGRKIDMVYDCEGNPLSPHKISVSFWNFPELKQYQFVQEGETSYLVKLNVNGKFTKYDELKGMLLDLVGKDGEIRIELVDEIPTLNSGKRKYILNNYK